MDTKKTMAAFGAAGALTLGGFLAGAVGPLHIASAQQSPSTTAPPAASPAQPATPGQGNQSTTGSNEDPTHEAGETPQQEADEDSGKAHHGGRHGGPSNEDPAHEAKETPQQEAEEDANNGAQAKGGSTTPSTAAPATGNTNG